jgi:hypothetical protein
VTPARVAACRSSPSNGSYRTTAADNYSAAERFRNRLFINQLRKSFSVLRIVRTRKEAPVGVEPTMADLQSAALATWLRRRHGWYLSDAGSASRYESRHNRQKLPVRPRS